VLEPGDYKLTIKYGQDRFESASFNFKYFADPIVSAISPACGPVEGYTQFKMVGSHFVEQGFGKAKCVFNSTIFMNATVVDKSTVYCDSPPLESTNGDNWYNVSISMDGGNNIANATAAFRYYKEPSIQSVTPWLGPIEGGTNIEVRGKGFKQANICDFRVRFEQKHLSFDNLNDTSFSVVSPPAGVSGAVVVSVSGNN